MSQKVWEVNFDGIVGPTHHYGGLASGNFASIDHGGSISFPKEAALQGLRKMKLLLEMGLKQGVFPPQERPVISALRRLGFEGSDAEVIERAYQKAPNLLASCWSASSMWAANAATVSPSGDTSDEKVHITPANLVSQFHRSLETPATSHLLRSVFSDGARFIHHAPLPAGAAFRDEGAANHTRLCRSHASLGIELFVYGMGAGDSSVPGPQHYPARQTKAASCAVARLHSLDPERTVFARQRADAIDAGVFHNDVIAVGNANVFLFHSRAFENKDRVLDELKRKFARCASEEPILIEIASNRLSVADAIDTYLFNSQLLSLPGGNMCLLAPMECEENHLARAVLREIEEEDNPIEEVRFVDIRQSMKNGGGPACLRLRVALSEAELACVHPSILLTDQLYETLIGWVERHYRDRLYPGDLADSKLIDESRAALDELTQILDLESLYSFQTEGA